MKYFGWLALLLIVSCKGTTQSKTTLPPTAFEKGMEQPNAQLLDVRRIEEYKDGHIKGALLADWTQKEAFADKTKALDKNKPLYVYCASGGRSAAAASWLRKQGYKEVYELEGGLINWKREGLPLEDATNHPQQSSQQYNTLINSQQAVLVDVGATWCPPCKKMEPVLADLQQTAGNTFKLVKLDADVESHLLDSLHVTALPTFIVYKAGKEVWRNEGITAKEQLLQQLQ